METAKVLSLIWKKPLIPINHLLGHFYANWVSRGGDKRGAPSSARNAVRTSDGAVSRQDPEKHTDPKFPCIGLLVSGGHTDLVLFKNHGKYEYLGGTRDDAAGECFDKCARLLGLPYPGGPEISRMAKAGDPKLFKLPKPMADSKDYDFSYSGLKTAVANLVNSSEFVVHRKKTNNYQLITNNLAASIEAAIVDSLVTKTLKAAKEFNVKTIILGGGVAANKKLKESLESSVLSLGIKLHIPIPSLCTDNGAMIAAAAFFEKPIEDVVKLQANPNLSLDLKI